MFFRAPIFLLSIFGLALLVSVTLPHPAAQAQTSHVSATAASAAVAPSLGKVTVSRPSKPLWSDLTASQQASLKPLETRWDNLGESSKRRWLALSKDYSRLSIEEQRTLHSRMTEWAALSGRERVQARLNFAQLKQLAPSDRKAKWEAYQALSKEDKRKLADMAPARPKSAAVPVRPVPAQKLVQVPPPPLKGEHGARIEIAPASSATRRTSLPVTLSTAYEGQVPSPVAATPTVSVTPAPGLMPVSPALAPADSQQ